MATAALGLEDVELVAHAADGTVSRVKAAEVLAGKHVAIYFSAHWCPPCRGFTPILAEVYGKVPSDEFEVVFCSSDRNARQFQEYFASMPWSAVPFEESALRTRLASRFGVESIPRLVIVGPNGAVVASDARSAVMADRAGAQFPWRGAAGRGGGLFGVVAPREILLILLVAYLLYDFFTKL